MEEAPGKAEAQAKDVIANWLQTELLVSRSYRNEAARKDEPGLFVDPAKRPTV
jgi:hypothetical protein